MGNPTTCHSCNSINAKFSCGKCKSSHYCNSQCQKLHWDKHHKILCDISAETKVFQQTKPFVFNKQSKKENLPDWVPSVEQFKNVPKTPVFDI